MKMVIITFATYRRNVDCCETSFGIL